MSREDIKDKLIELIEPLLENRGFELIRLEYVPGKQGHLHLYIDHEGGITIDQCEIVSNAVSDLLDYQDPISHTYTLEVSSPGLERPLTKKKHFERFVGKKVKIKTTEPLDGRKKFSGELKKTGEDSIFVKLEEGFEAEIPLDKIEKANLWYTKAEKDRLAKGGNEGR
ncbi:MAG: ribosome maturation factor RimP [Bacillota bacterium]